MEYNYITIETYDDEGGFYNAEYRWYWTQNENGKYIQTEELSEGEWHEYDGFDKKSDLTSWIKGQERYTRQARKMLEREAKHNAKIAKIEALMTEGLTEEEAEALA